jgi:hypothetical protein
MEDAKTIEKFGLKTHLELLRLAIIGFIMEDSKENFEGLDWMMNTVFSKWGFYSTERKAKDANRLHQGG